jgi:hypothetical protein
MKFKFTKPLISIIVMMILTSYKVIYNVDVMDCKLFLKDSVTIKTNIGDFEKNCSFIKVFSYKNKDYISILNSRTNCLDFFSTQKAGSNFKIKLPYGIDEIYDYKIENENSIYFVTEKNKIFLCGNDKIEKEYTITDIIPLFFKNYCLFSTKSFPLEVYKNQIFVYNMPQERLDDLQSQKRIFSTKRDLHLIKKNGKLVIGNITGGYPSEFKYRNYNNFFPIRVFNGNSSKLVYSFSHSQKVEVVDIETNKSRELALNDGNLFAKNDTFPFSKILDRNFKLKYSTENDRFVSMIYDSYSKKYIRVLSKGMKYDNGDGTVNTVLDKPLYFLIYDEKFKLEKVVKFPAGKYNYLSILPTAGGILVSKDHPLNRSKDKVKYDLFKLY